MKMILALVIAVVFVAALVVGVRTNYEEFEYETGTCSLPAGVAPGISSTLHDGRVVVRGNPYRLFLQVNPDISRATLSSATLRYADTGEPIRLSVPQRNRITGGAEVGMTVFGMHLPRIDHRPLIMTATGTLGADARPFAIECEFVPLHRKFSESLLVSYLLSV